MTQDTSKAYTEEEHLNRVADPVMAYMSKPEIEKMLQKTKAAMQKAAKELDFMEAARLRDEMFMLEEKLKELKPVILSLGRPPIFQRTLCRMQS